MNEYRVTKYNPKNRDAQGRYLLDEWTEMWDIGQEYAGQVLTEATYQRVENAYLDVVTSFLETIGVSQMIVRYHPKEIWRPKNYRDGEAVNLSAAREIVKSLLRSEYWCRLESSVGAFVHVGYDYYMYLGEPVPSADWKALAAQRDLFVEPFESPYKKDEDSCA